MQAFSVRQLKSNPSTVLKAAEADAMALVTSHQQPAALVVALDRLGLPDTAAVRSGLALSLFQAGSLAAEGAAVDRCLCPSAQRPARAGILPR
jgi:antitoxin (DNA-binding transcriptional repressor) of toxin-antitoxin stability system